MSALPVSPIAPTSSGPAAQAGVVQMNLNATTGQIVTGAEFGMGTTMGDLNHTYLPYADPAFQAVADQHPFDLLRHNWELNTMMDIIYPSRGSAPNFTNIDTYLKQQGNLTGFFNNQGGTQVVTLGFPSWLNISSPSDQQLYAGMVKQIAQHFIAMGEPVADYELVNEPDGQYTVTDMANTFNVVAQALKSVDPSYRLGGLTETYPRMDDLKTFFQIAGPNIGFVSYHQYVTNGSDGKSDQQVVNDSLTASTQGPEQVRALMQASGISDSVPIFLGEYNVDGANFDDPNNGNMVGAVAAAAVTYGLIASDSNATMGALWCAENGSAYSAFGGVGNYQADPIAVVLSDLTQYMPGNIVQTTMPSNTPGLVGYTTEYGQGFSTALIDTNLSVGYTVDLSHDGLPATGLFRVEVSNAHPGGVKTAITDLAHVSVAAGSVVIITNEAPHGGVEFTGGTTTGGTGTGGTGTGGTGTGGTGTGGTGTGGTGTGGTGSTTPPLITPGTGSFTDAAGNVYTIDASGNADENGSPISGGSGTGAMELANGVVYAQDASSKSWYTWNQSTFTASAAPPAGTGTTTGGITTTSSGTIPPVPPSDTPASYSVAAFDTSTDQPLVAVCQDYTGPVLDLDYQYINITSDNLNITAVTPNCFIHSGSGDDAIAVNSGTNVLDGGNGSNFLTGGSGADTFFVDDRAAQADVWSTVNNFQAGDAATIWGVTPQDFGLTWVDGQGAAGFTGLTLHATAPGRPTASLTLAGFSQADLGNGRLSVMFGADPASGSAYMYVHGNS